MLRLNLGTERSFLLLDFTRLRNGHPQIAARLSPDDWEKLLPSQVSGRLGHGRPSRLGSTSQAAT